MTTTPSKEPLPDSWVERIFQRMQGLYGSLWVDRWRSGEKVERGGQLFDSGLLNAKATWAMELGGFSDQPERIARALESCRHRNMPPTLPEFIDLCRQQVAEQAKALPPPTPDAERRQRNIESAAAVKVGSVGNLQWAERLRTRYLAGERLLPIQVQLASEALGEVWEGGAEGRTSRARAFRGG